MPRFRCPCPALFVLLLSPLLLVGCGRAERPGTKPLWPALYEIAPDDVPAVGQFIRYKPAGPKGGGLDVAVTEYVSEAPNAPRIQLVGVVHIADKLYYEHVQAVLDRADLVLFEAIKPDKLAMADWQASMAPHSEHDIASFQQELASWFGFEYQLQGIDYRAPSFVHADMTVTQFRDAGGAKLLDEGPLKAGVGNPADLPQEVQTVLDEVRAFGRLLMGQPNPIRSLARRLMAEAMGSLDEVDPLEMFPGLGELILTKRNAFLFEILKQQLDKTNGTIAVFYGAAHNADLEQRLATIGYRRSSGYWLRAWALRPPLH